MTSVVSRRGIGWVVVAVSLAGCGSGTGGDVAGVVAAAKAPFAAFVHRDVRAFCAAFTPQAKRRLVRIGRSPVAGRCENTMRPFVEDPGFAQMNRHVLAGMRVSAVVIRGSFATARVRDNPRDAGSVVKFRKAPNGRWQIADLEPSSHVTTIIR